MSSFKASALAAAALLAVSSAQATVTLLEEGFDDIQNLPGWVQLNESVPLGTSAWFQGNISVFPSHVGASDSYIAANFNNTAGAGVISNWLMTPVLDLSNGADLSFWTRAALDQTFPDRLEVRLSTNGASSSPADFSTLLLSINPDQQANTYPTDWTQFTLAIPAGLSGRIAFHYSLTNAGPAGSNGNFIGIDTVQITAVPEPGTWALMGLGLAGVAGLARRRQQAA